MLLLVVVVWEEPREISVFADGGGGLLHGRVFVLTGVGGCCDAEGAVSSSLFSTVVAAYSGAEGRLLVVASWITSRCLPFTGGSKICTSKYFIWSWHIILDVPIY